MKSLINSENQNIKPENDFIERHVIQVGGSNTPQFTNTV